MCETKRLKGLSISLLAWLNPLTPFSMLNVCSKSLVAVMDSRECWSVERTRLATGGEAGEGCHGFGAREPVGDVVIFLLSFCSFCSLSLCVFNGDVGISRKKFLLCNTT